MREQAEPDQPAGFVIGIIEETGVIDNIPRCFPGTGRNWWRTSPQENLEHFIDGDQEAAKAKPEKHAQDHP